MSIHKLLLESPLDLQRSTVDYGWSAVGNTNEFIKVSKTIQKGAKTTTIQLISFLMI